MFKRVGIGGGASSVAVVSLTLALGAFVTPAAGQTPGEPVLVPGGDDMTLQSVSCASTTDCVAVGLTVEGRGEDFTSNSWVVRISRGTIGAPVKVGSTHSFLTDVACPTAGNCIAVGTTVVPIRNGTPGAPITVPGVNRLFGVACWTASDCVAVGAGRGESIVVPISDGAPQTPVAVPGVQTLLGVACATATCQAVGMTIPQGQQQYRPAGAVVPISNGKPGTPTTVPEASAFDGIACPSATACLVGGEAGNPEDPSAVSMPLTDGARGPVTTVNGPQFLHALACKSATECLAIGGRGLDGGENNGFFVVPFTDRRPGDARLYPEGNYGGLACVGTAGCLAVGATESRAAVLPFGLKIAPFTAALEQVASPQEGLTISKLLAEGAPKQLFKAPSAGKLAIGWYQGTAPARVAKTTRVAVGRRSFTKAGKAKVAVRLTKAGRRLLKNAKRRLTLVGKASFTPTGGKTTTTKPAKFTLKL